MPEDGTWRVYDGSPKRLDHAMCTCTVTSGIARTTTPLLVLVVLKVTQNDQAIVDRANKRYRSASGLRRDHCPFAFHASHSWYHLHPPLWLLQTIEVSQLLMTCIPGL
jgi:hypothetical protein